MTARDGMTDLISRLRGMTNAGTVDYTTVNDGDMPKYLRDNQARFSYLWR